MSESAKAQIGEALAARLTPEQLELLMDNVLSIEKTARGWCPSCKKAVHVTVSDPRAVTSALNDLMIQAWGRPGQSEQGEDRSVTFTNKVVLVADDE